MMTLIQFVHQRPQEFSDIFKFVITKFLSYKERFLFRFVSKSFNELFLDVCYIDCSCVEDGSEYYGQIHKKLIRIEGEEHPVLQRGFHGQGELYKDISKKNQIKNMFLIQKGEFFKGYLKHGKKISPSGKLFEGEFFCEYPGWLKSGKFISIDGSIIESEKFYNNSRIHKGKITYPKFTFEGTTYYEYTAEGKFNDENDLIEGTVTESNGMIWQGKFNNNGYLNGLGKVTTTNGQTFEGNFINSVFSFGTSYHLDGTIEKGNFFNGKLHGEGSITRFGVTSKGQFENGQLIHKQGHK